MRIAFCRGVHTLTVGRHFVLFSARPHSILSGRGIKLTPSLAENRRNAKPTRRCESVYLGVVVQRVRELFKYIRDV